MKETPIIFSTKMVRAILEGRKTMTRRPVKEPYQTGMKLSGHEAEPEKCPYGNPGDRLWVKETFMPCVLGSEDGGLDNYTWLYKADGDLNNAIIEQMEDQSWKPSIHMPRIASRITLEIKDVKIERLQDISEEDAIKEGIESKIFERIYPVSKQGKFTGYKLYYENGNDYDENPITSFWSLWEFIYGKESWLNNPWVFVVEFNRI